MYRCSPVNDTKTVAVTSPVASIQFTGAVTVDTENSSDEEGVEAINFASNDGTTDANSSTSCQLGIKDNHFSVSEDDVHPHCSIEELQQAIDKYKMLAKDVIPHTDEGKKVIRHLVQLRLKLLEAKEQAELQATNGMNVSKYRIMGHNFERHAWHRAKGYCEKCNGVIIAVVQPWCQCSYCGYCCHSRCMNHITRMCVITRVIENPVFILAICPEKGLHAQNYRCAECLAPIGFQPGLREPRLCDYSGLYYCNYCHWNDTMVIPARVISNWDFQSQKVSRVSKQYLRLMLRKPILRIEDLNPMLFRYLEELNEVKHRREEIIIMKSYFLKCPSALNSKLLCQLSSRQHFVDNADIYSLQDLIDLANDVLLPEVTSIHANFAQHIKTDCDACQSTGSRCRLCDSDEVLFPFDSFASVCPECSAVYHRHCYMTSQNSCKCVVCQHQQKRHGTGGGLRPMSLLSAKK